MGYTYITNPVSDSGTYFLTGNALTGSANRGNQGYLGYDFTTFIYGSSLLYQVPSVIYTGSSYILSSIPYNGDNYIGQIDLSNSTPNGFSLSAVTNATLNQLYTSNIVTIAGLTNGINSTFVLSGNSASLYKNGTNI